jgi:hypothetical protein
VILNSSDSIQFILIPTNIYKKKDLLAIHFLEFFQDLLKLIAVFYFIFLLGAGKLSTWPLITTFVNVVTLTTLPEHTRLSKIGPTFGFLQHVYNVFVKSGFKI